MRIINGIIHTMFCQEATEGGEGAILQHVPAVAEGAALEGEHLPAVPQGVEAKLPEGAEISFQQLGEERARATVKFGEQAESLVEAVRQDCIKVLAGPEASWATYVSGFTLVQAKREAEQKDTRHLKNVKSQVNRLFKAAKGNPLTVRDQLANTKLSWGEVQKALPKQGKSGRPQGGAQPTAGEGAAAPVSRSNDGTITETNIGSLVQEIGKVAARLEEVSKGRKSPYGMFMARSIIDMMATAEKDYQHMFAEYSQKTGGNFSDHDAMLVHFGLKKAA